MDDRYDGNPISCTVDEFRAFCGFFRRYFDVITVGELLERLESGRSISGTLVITFDDGYADNVRAAEILREHCLPACFFIATSFIGTDQTGWWDSKKGVESEWMAWEDIKRLDAWGFEIGAHTRTHAHLGEVGLAEATTEIQGSKSDLELRLGHPVEHFAFPFGRRDCITPENREIVANEFRSCMSAFGGAISPEADPFHLARVPVNQYYTSPYELGLGLIRERPHVVTERTGVHV